MLFLGAEAHDVFDAGAIVPAAVEDHDLSSGREMLYVSLDEHLALFPIGRSGEGYGPKHARAYFLGESLDRASLAGGIAPFEQDDDP